MMKGKKNLKIYAICLLTIESFQIVYPNLALALTSGPSQPEMQQFSPIGTSDMVDLFTGDFSYNIPLLDVEGYPINIGYSSGISADQESTWVGLGWNINPGVVSRDLRGIPDDFNGDIMTQKKNIKDNWTVGVQVGVNKEITGWDLLGPNGYLTGDLFYNSYRSFGYSVGLSLLKSVAGPLNASLNVSIGNQSGLDISPSLSLGTWDDESYTSFIELGAGINSRSGLKSISLNSDKKNSIHEYGFGSGLGALALNFGNPAFFPSADMPSNNFSFTFTGKGGSEFMAFFPNGTISGYFYLESLKEKQLEIPAYGTLFSAKGSTDDNALLDFTREKDIAVRETSVNIAIPTGTFDIFNISGQGVSGSYHATRNDLGVFHDRFSQVGGLTIDAGVDGGVGVLSHLGFELSGVVPKTTTGVWEESNKFKDVSEYTSLNGENLYEPVYFKNAGEFQVDKGTLFTTLGKTKRTRVVIEKDGSNTTAEKKIIVQDLFSGEGHVETIGSNLQNNVRLARHQLFSYMTAAEAQSYALNKKILNFPVNENLHLSCLEFGTIPIDSLERTTYGNDHISEITVTQPDGKRYIYGIPAYNKTQTEATFAVDDEDASPSTGLVDYVAGFDDTEDNNNGKDHYFDSKQIPAYAHSYLLTDVLSTDYVDNTGNGVSPDDKGQAYRLNYSKMDYTFNWRTPIDSASYQEGLKTTDNDDKGSYVYGEKEVWFLHSIESRNLVAQFNLSDRNDGLGVENINGGKDLDKRLKKLDRIDLYSKADLLKYGEYAIPIKSVHFVYDYTLCIGAPNNVYADSGKLTLKSIYFTYGNNTKGIINQYQFDYDEGNPISNPEYNSLNYDRWGNYKDHALYASYFPDNLNYPNTIDFPYALQDKIIADTCASVWNLKHIKLPSGGTINIEYESDDYAYVQDKRATQMVFVKGFGEDSSTLSIDNKLYQTFDNLEYMFLELPTYVESNSEFEDLYLDGLDYLYYKFLIDVTGDGEREYIQGYCKWELSGIFLDGASSTNIAWLKIDMIEEENIGSAHPIALNSWQFLRLNLPEKAYPGSDISTGDAEDIIWGVLSIIPSFFNLIFGFNNMARLDGKGKYVDLDKSWVKLNNPTYQKFGGGSRVSKITISDNWSDMVSTQDSYEYGQEYSYTKYDEALGKTISSGVASYEPAIGGEENALKKPVFYEEKAMLAPNNNYYSELPLGESLYPSPQVGYSEVKVKNLDREKVTRTATGYTLSKFYTAKDFPVIATYTGLDPIRVKPNPILKFLKVGVKDYLTCSQGFYIEVNDMHGKPKEESVYDATGFLISSKVYHYKVDDVNVDSKHLNNQCSVINPDGSVTIQTIGLDFEAWQDMRQQETKIIGGGVKVNTEIFVIPWFPPILIVLPGVYPSFTNSHTRFRSTATTKFVKRYGILDKITVTDKGSTITTENVLYDSETGQVLMSKVTNEFEDPIYKFNYPAHWIYKNMGPSYVNIGGEFRNVTVVNGEIIGLTDPEAYFIEGDEIAVFFDGMSMGEKLHVIKPDGSIVLINSNGVPYTKYDPTGTFAQTLTLKIIRSGNRNQSTFPAGSITSLEYPIVGGEISFSDASEIINADAIVYSDQWKAECQDLVTECDTSSISSQCFDEFISSLLNDPGSFEFFWVTQENAVNIDAFFEFEGCLSDDTSFYMLSDLDDLGVYQNLEDLTEGALYLPALCDFEAVLGDCKIHFNNAFGCIPLLQPNMYTLGPTAEPDGAYTVTYTGPDALWRSDTLLTDTEIGYFYTECLVCEEVCVEYVSGDTVNPFMKNMKGVWRPLKSYAFHDLRTPSAATPGTNIRTDGSYDNFDEFYSYNSGTEVWNIDSVDENWIWTNESTLFDKHGNEIESKNALNIYSSALYGYNKSLVVAVANNAKIYQIASDNFEDYDFKKKCGDIFCVKKHWSYEDSLDLPEVAISDEFSHSGKNSLKVSEGENISNEKDIVDFEGEMLELTVDSNLFVLGDNPCISDFSPNTGDYLFSAWVMVDTACHCTNYEDDFVAITFPGATGVTYSFNTSGPVIEGWQRIQGKFNVPSTATGIIVKLISDETNDTYFDDVRIHPYHGNMKTFVYDRKSMRLMAELDENNYATFYEFDDEGMLVRVKRETEKGIMTIQEGRGKLKSNL